MTSIRVKTSLYNSEDLGLSGAISESLLVDVVPWSLVQEDSTGDQDYVANHRQCDKIIPGDYSIFCLLELAVREFGHSVVKNTLRQLISA